LREIITYTEEDLIRLLLVREEAAFTYLYDHYAPALYGIISRIVPEEELAQDILQEVFVRIWKNFPSYDPGKGRLFTWMANISRNLAIDHVRSKANHHALKNQSLSDSVSKVNRTISISNNTDLIGVKSFVEKLKPEYKEIINLLYFGGYTQEETARELNLPLGTVKTRTRSALQQLREILK
jgi:RNA polymerase sigma factor (sigma-70 family)